MSKNEIMKSVTRAIGKTKLSLHKHSPEILLTAGIVGVVASAVMACKATTKAGDILEESKAQVDAIHEVANNPEMAEKYTEEDKKKDLAIVYAQTGLQYAKLYGPAVLTGVVSIGCILASHNIIHKRNVSLAAAYTAVDRSFKDYRKRVVERFGKELDRELKYNIKVKEIEEKVVDENGNETTVTKQIEVADIQPSEFTFVFDETSLAWNRDAEINKCTLMQAQAWANDKLKTDGYLFLNDVLDAIGIRKCRAGFEVGWIYEENNQEGDNFVDFGILDIHNETKRAFINGYEQSVWLDFNVDGPILHRVFRRS